MFSEVCLRKPVSVNVPLYEAVGDKLDISELQVNVHTLPSVCIHFGNQHVVMHLLFNYTCAL